MCLTGRSCTGQIRLKKRKRQGRLGFWATGTGNTGFRGGLERSAAASAGRAAAPRRRSPASRGSGDPLATSSPGAAPSLELTIARQNVALGQEKQHAGQVADRPQRFGHRLHLVAARAHFRARRRGCGAGRAERGVSGRDPQAHCCRAPPEGVGAFHLGG